MKNFILSVLPFVAVGIVVSLIACEKEEVLASTPIHERATFTIRPVELNDRVGEEEDEDVIQGRLEDSQQTGIAEAQVYLLKASDSTAVDNDITASNGDFQVSAVSGSYFFHLILSNSNSVYTDSFELNGNAKVTIKL